MALISEPRPVRDFDEVELQVYGDILLVQGDEESLTIEAEESVLPRIQTEVRNRRLVIKPARLLDRLMPHTGPIHYYISMKEVHGLSISGAGTLATPQIHTDQLHLDVSGSADMRIDHLETPSLRLDVSGSAKVQIGAGRVDRQIFHISGSSNVSAAQLESQETDLQISGSGQVQVNAQQTLSVTIAGVANVRYAGNPKITSQISGVGQIEKLIPS